MTENTESDETVLSRREALQGGSALAGAAIVSKFTTGAVNAQSTEPRLQLGDDWAIDDDGDGSGNNDLRLTHQPTGAELRYDVSDGAWIPSQPIGTASDRQDHFADTGDFNSVKTNRLSVNASARAHLSTDQTVSNSTDEQLALDTTAFDKGAGFDTAAWEYNAPVAGVYLATLSAQFLSVEDGVACIVRVNVNGATESESRFFPSSSGGSSPVPQTTGHIQLSAGDTVTTSVFYNGSSSIDISSVNKLTYLAISQIA